jgi:Gpi18-like mannosyltransferase
MKKENTVQLIRFGILALAALAFRYYLAPQNGFPYDLKAFSFWASHGRPLNFFGFYSSRSLIKLSFPNYALYFPILALLGPTADFATAAGRTLLKTPAIFGDIFLAGVVYFSAKPKWKFVAAAFILFNPAVWFDSTVYGQVDCFHAAFMALAVLALADRKYRLSWIWLVIALFFKVQAVAIFPLIAAVHFKGSGFKKMFLEIIPAAALAALISLPFILVSSWSGIWRSLRGSVGMFALVEINAWNPWLLLHAVSGRYVSDAETFYGVSYRNIGLVALALAVAAIICALPKRPGRAVLFAAAAAMYFSFFMLSTEMHERYLYPFLPMVAALLGESWVVASVAVIVSVVLFLNIDFVRIWSPVFEPFVRSGIDCVFWSLALIIIFAVFLIWYVHRAAREKQDEASAITAK